MSKKVTPLQAIRDYCLQRCGGQAGVHSCHKYSCPLRPYRFGHRPTAKNDEAALQQRHSPEKLDKLIEMIRRA